MSEEGTTTRRSGVKQYALLALAIVVYATAVWIIGWRKVGDALADANIGLVAAAAGLTTAGALTRIWKWHRALGADRHAVGVYFLSRSAGVWSPARVGEFLPLLWKRHRNARLAGWILFDRVLEVLVTLGFGVVSLGFVDLLPAKGVIAIALLTVGASGIGLYVLTRRDLIESIARRAREDSRWRVALEGVAETSGELRNFLRSPWELTAYTVFAKALDLYAVVLIFSAVGERVGFALVAASKCALAIVSYLPVTPVATGVPHAVQGWMMLESAGIQADTLVASVGIEAGIMFLVFLLTAAGGLRQIRRAAL